MHMNSTYTRNYVLSVQNPEYFADSSMMYLYNNFKHSRTLLKVAFKPTYTEVVGIQGDLLFSV